VGAVASFCRETRKATPEAGSKAHTARLFEFHITSRTHGAVCHVAYSAHTSQKERCMRHPEILKVILREEFFDLGRIDKVGPGSDLDVLELPAGRRVRNFLGVVDA
jgi:hypothetical protein